MNEIKQIEKSIDIAANEIRYGYGLCEECDLCGTDYPIHKYNFFHELNNKNYIELINTQFLCPKCKE